MGNEVISNDIVALPKKVPVNSDHTLSDAASIKNVKASKDNVVSPEEAKNARAKQQLFKATKVDMKLGLCVERASEVSEPVNSVTKNEGNSDAKKDVNSGVQNEAKPLNETATSPIAQKYANQFATYFGCSVADAKKYLSSPKFLRMMRNVSIMFSDYFNSMSRTQIVAFLKGLNGRNMVNVAKEAQAQRIAPDKMDIVSKKGVSNFLEEYEVDGTKKQFGSNVRSG